MRWIRSLIEELTPIAVLGVANGLYGFRTAVLAMAGSMLLIVIVSAVSDDDTPWFAVCSTAGVVGFALLSFLFGEFEIFALSDTLIDGALGLLLLISLSWDRTVLSRLFSRTFAITEKAWRILSRRWGVFLLLLAAANETVRQLYSNDVWVSFKLYATASLLLFGCFQFRVSMRHRIESESNALGLRR